MNIVVEGGDRFRLLELTHGRSFTTGVVEEMADDDDPPAPDDITRALELFHELAERAGGEVDVPDPDTEQLDFELAARVDFGSRREAGAACVDLAARRMERLVELLDQRSRRFGSSRRCASGPVATARSRRSSPTLTGPSAYTTTPAPPRRASPAAASVPSASTSTAFVPPK